MTKIQTPKARPFDPFAGVDTTGTRLDKIEAKLNFMGKRMGIIINQRVNEILTEKGMEDFLIEITRNFIHNNFDAMVRMVVEETVARMNKNIKNELEITKALCGSIDDEVKKTIRSMDCSYATDKLIEEKLSAHINQFLKSKRVDNEVLLVTEDTTPEANYLDVDSPSGNLFTADTLNNFIENTPTENKEETLNNGKIVEQCRAYRNYKPNCNNDDCKNKGICPDYKYKEEPDGGWEDGW